MTKSLDLGTGMTPGAFLLVDCLGFRRIWDRIDPDKLVKRLEAVQTTVNSLVPDFARRILSGAQLRPQIRFLSDSLAISVPAPEHPRPFMDARNCYSILLLCSIESHKTLFGRS